MLYGLLLEEFVSNLISRAETTNNSVHVCIHIFIYELREETCGSLVNRELIT